MPDFDCRHSFSADVLTVALMLIANRTALHPSVVCNVAKQCVLLKKSLKKQIAMAHG